MGCHNYFFVCRPIRPNLNQVRLQYINMQADTQPTAQPTIQSLEQLIALAKSYIDNAPAVDNEFIYQLGTLSAYAVNRMKALQHPLYGLLAEAGCIVYNNICDIIPSVSWGVGIVHLEDIDKYIMRDERCTTFKQMLTLRNDLKNNILITPYNISCDLVKLRPYVYACYKNWSTDTIVDLPDTLRAQFGINSVIVFNKTWNGYQITFECCGNEYGEYYEDFRKMICEKLYDLGKDYCDDIVQAPTAIDRITNKQYICSLNAEVKDMFGLYNLLGNMRRQPTMQSAQPTPAEPTEIIYAIVDEPYRNRVKIGRTEQTVDARRKQLETGAGPLKIIHSVTKTKNCRFETYLHRLHASRRIHGEWFMFMEHEIDELTKTMV